MLAKEDALTFTYLLVEMSSATLFIDQRFLRPETGCLEVPPNANGESVPFNASQKRVQKASKVLAHSVYQLNLGPRHC